MSNNKMISVCFSSVHKGHDLCDLPVRKKYRTHFEIMALVLEAVTSNGATRFSISRHTGTSYKLLGKYLQTLTEIGFIEMDIKENRIVYRISNKGLDFLRQYYVLLGILLSASVKNRSTSVVYEPKYDAPNMEQRSATQIVTHL